MLMDCQNCDEEIHVGPVLTTLEHDGLPVIPFDLAAQETFTCDNCNAANYTGDFDVMVEFDDA